jgi:hypothetical protein
MQAGIGSLFSFFLSFETHLNGYMAVWKIDFANRSSVSDVRQSIIAHGPPKSNKSIKKCGIDKAAEINFKMPTMEYFNAH